MARRKSTSSRLLPRPARLPSRKVTLRPIALAVLATLAGGLGGSAWAGMQIRMALPRARPTGLIDMTRLNLQKPADDALPETAVDLKDKDGNAQNIAKSGTAYGARSVQNVSGASLNVLDLSMQSAKSILQFNSFDVGSKAAVNVWFTDKDSSSLFQIANTVAPSQIYGALSTYYKDAQGQRQVGGELFLINQNGILFGKGAQVNVGGLIASALNMDEADYLSGLQSISAAKPTFFGWTDSNGVSTYAPENNFVKVDQQANITTASGGRVFLLGGQVENSGSITTPSGQTVLASGREIYLANPAGGVTPLYMAEKNANVPTVKGLLVEVNGLMNEHEFATNSATGSINVPTGNATVVGWAVNQQGRISATTSVNQNGSVYLLARSGTVMGRKDVPGGQTIVTKFAQSGGALTLVNGRADSGIFIAPDNSSDADGNAAKAAASSVFTPSRIELSGKTIDIQKDAKIVAPNATLNVRAAIAPAYTYADLQEGGKTESGSGARVLLGAGTLLDVSGTMGTQESVARNFVTTQLLGAQDLKDAPLQKDGPIYRSELTFDIRGNAPILGDISSYRDAVQMSASEFMSAGGKVSLTSTGAIVAHPSSRIDVSGGQVTYTDATVNPSVLVAEDGHRYTLNTAPIDVNYVAIVGKKGDKVTRFGKESAALVSPLAVAEPGYVDGKAAGQLAVMAPVALMDGQLKAGTVSGARQRAGLDPIAAWGTLIFGAGSNRLVAPDPKDPKKNIISLGDSNFISAIVSDLKISKAASSLGDAFWATSDDGSTAMEHDLGTQVSRISADQINASGFGTLQFAANHSIELAGGANLVLPRQAEITLQAGGKNGITIGANVRSEGGAFTAIAKELNGATTPTGGGITVKSGVTIDMSGNWVNQYHDGNAVAPALDGGSITLKSNHALNVEDQSMLNVSGGATVTSSGTFQGSKAGSITLEGLDYGQLGVAAGDGTDRVHIGASLWGYGLSQGGSLNIKGWDVTVAGAGGLTQGPNDTSLNIGSGFFNQGGFSSFSVDGQNSLTIRSGTVIQPRPVYRRAGAKALYAATGSDFMKETVVDTRSDVVRPTQHLKFASSGMDNVSGKLSVEQGARIQTDPLGFITLTATNSLHMDGSAISKGGSVQASLVRNQDEIAPGDLALGQHAVLDVSGGALYTPGPGDLSFGTMYDGGSIRVSVSNSKNFSEASIDIANGAALLADGAVAQTVTPRTAGSVGPAYVKRVMASNGGTIDVEAGSGGAHLGGAMSAKAGNDGAVGGSLVVGLGINNGATSRPAGLGSNAHTIHIQDALVGEGPVVANELTVSAKSIQQGGFANLYVTSLDKVQFIGDVTLRLPGHLRLDAPVLSAAKGAHVLLRAGSTLQLGYTDRGMMLPNLSQASAGNASLDASGGLLELFGNQATQGFAAIQLSSDSELRLRGLTKGGSTNSYGSDVGSFTTAADLTLSATQTVPTTLSDYTFNAANKTVTFTGGDPQAATPLSGGGSLTVNAANIVQNGVIKAPFGTISLNATNSITLGANSLTSVSGDDLLVPYGETTGGGNAWTYNNKSVTTFKDKAIALNAGGQTVSVAKGAKLNLSGGGNLVGYEFVPGPGGSKDIFAGAAGGAFAIVPTVRVYAPYDAAILNSGDSHLSLDPSAGNALSLGNTLTFGNGGPIAAGTYAILPARYALLPGAYLVKADSSTKNVALGYTHENQDGSYVVGAIAGVSGQGIAANAMAVAYKVMTSDQARRYSEIRETTADAYQLRQAALNGVAPPLLSPDAGRLSIVADKLLLDGQLQFGHANGQRGGQLDIAGTNIRVSDSGVADSGVLSLTYDQLNHSGAESILLGGTRGQSNADNSADVAVSAQTVSVDASAAGKALTIGDLTLAAQDTVAIADGVSLQSGPLSGSSQALNFKGDGALLRASADTSASTQRSQDGTQPQGQQGHLKLGNNLNVKGGTLIAEATQSSEIANALKAGMTVNVSKLALGAGHIEVAGHDQGATDAPLVINDRIASQLNAVGDLTLRSFGTIDLYGSTTLGGAGMRTLTVDTGHIRMMQDGKTGTLTAGAVNLLNTTGNSGATPAGGTSTLQINATGANGGTGHVTIGGGDSVTVSGVAQTSVAAAGSIVMQGKGGLVVPGDLAFKAGSLTAARAASGKLDAQGAFSLDKADGTVAQALAGPGANLAIHAQSVAQRGNIAMPSGKLTINSDKTAQFGAGSITDLSGYAKSIDNVPLTTMGGDLSVASANGDILLAPGGVLNVSAALGQSQAGTMSFSAANGKVVLDGRILATSKAGQKGGSLSVDARDAMDLKALAQRIAAETDATTSNFAQSISLRNRNGDQVVAPGTTLSANQINLSLDAGDLLVQGSLHANGAAGGKVSLSASGNIVLSAGGSIEARALADGGDGGKVSINTVNGLIDLDQGTIDTSGQGSGADGVLSLRAPRTPSGVSIAPIGSSLKGVREIDVEAVQRYDANGLGATGDASGAAAYVQSIMADIDRYLNGAQGIRNSLSSKQPGIADKIVLRAGVELYTADDMSLSPQFFADGWNLTSYGSGGNPMRQPFNLTLRTAGNLYVGTYLGDGFLNGIAQSGPAGNIRLVAGADLQSSDVMATVASPDVGDILIGDPSGSQAVSVRNTTGNIEMAAGRDIKLLNASATVYTTGASVDEANLQNSSDAKQGYAQVTDKNAAKKLYLQATRAPFLTGGGSITAKAGRDVAWLPDPTTAPQFITDWWYRYANSKASDQYAWWSRYDKFQQGFATFGGGDIAVQAGRDAWNVQALAATNGFLSSGGWGKTYGGGSVSVVAGRDVVGGAVMSSKDALVQAGRSIAPSSVENDLALLSSPKSALQLLYGGGQSNLMARNDLTLERATVPGFLGAINELNQANTISIRKYLQGRIDDANLQVTASAGDVVYKGNFTNTNVLNIYGAPLGAPDVVPTLPGAVSFSTAEGNVSLLEDILQAPSHNTKFDVLATGSVDMGKLTQIGIDSADVPTVISSVADVNNPYQAFTLRQIGSSDRTPVRIVAENGNVTYSGAINVLEGLRMVAGRDIDQSEATALISIQHQTPSEISLFQAGRDFVFSSGNAFGVDLAGPGDLVIAVGRNLDLKATAGIEAKGSLTNRDLVKSNSANITILAGVDFKKGDITDAVNAFYPLLGGKGVAADPGQLYTEIKVQQALDAFYRQWGPDGQSLTPTQLAQRDAAKAQAQAQAISSAQADLATHALTDLAGAMAGDAAYQQAVLGFVSHRQNAAVSASQAADAFKSMTAAEQNELAGQVLAKVWAAAIPNLSDRIDMALAMAPAAQTSQRAAAFMALVKQRTGRDLDLKSALESFAGMPVEQQALIVTKILSDDVTSAIADAASKSGSSRQAAYDRAYQALSTVFPYATAQTANINLGASQIKTLQNSTAMLFNPNGGVDVGALTAKSAADKTPQDLGLVTAGGGDLSVVVRDDINVHDSRVFTLIHGNEAIWSSLGSVDAGRGARTVTSTPAPVYYIDDHGQLQIDTTSAISGSGIAATGLARIAAPKGEINAGDAGISATQGLDLAASVIRNADAISSPVVHGGPPPAAVNLAAAAPVPTQAANAGLAAAGNDDSDDEKKKRRRRRNILLDFLGFGSGDADTPSAPCSPGSKDPACNTNAATSGPATRH